jgi:hypothetical protein
MNVLLIERIAQNNRLSTSWRKLIGRSRLRLSYPRINNRNNTLASRKPILT